VLKRSPFHQDIAAALIFRWTLDVINDNHLYRTFRRHQFETKLLLQRRKQIWCFVLIGLRRAKSNRSSIAVRCPPQSEIISARLSSLVDHRAVQLKE